MKVKLKKSDTNYWMPEGHTTKSINYALPFYLSVLGKYFHRVRSAQTHWDKNGLTHISVHFWCGNSGFIGKKGKLYSRVPENGVLCATCEGRAIGSGLDGARIINGNPVMYSPR